MSQTQTFVLLGSLLVCAIEFSILIVTRAPFLSFLLVGGIFFFVILGILWQSKWP